MAGRLGLRALAEWLLWLPLTLIFSANMGGAGKAGLAAGVLLCAALGLGLNGLPALWRRLVLIAAAVALTAAGIARFADHLPMLVWLCVVLWRGRFVRFGYGQFGLAFGVCCLVLFAISLNEAWLGYRTAVIALAVFWMIGWFAALNRSLIDRAGLDNGIVTRPVLQSSRKYALLFAGVGVLAIALTVGYGEKLLTPREIAVPSPRWIEPEQLIPPPQQMNSPLEGLLQEDKGKPSPIWDYLFWGMAALAAIGFLWFVRWLWKERTWTWRSLLAKVRDWFVRERRTEKLPYVEERRSLRKEKKPGQGLFGSRFRRPRARLEWERLSNAEKVRRLYEEAVAEGIRQGYAFVPADTPGETLAKLESWQASRGPAKDKERQAAYWSWFSRVRSLLAGLYGRARYSPHDIAAEEVEELRKGLS
ncbi:hypothetical protein [Cohnella hongkongensis]|uniref:DUF4129 domain-containing protein n=1 Tax=Cohnella hongkongensis TaxID=178337 RepID=A0ABV9FJ24_9BACL